MQDYLAVIKPLTALLLAGLVSSISRCQLLFSPFIHNINNLIILTVVSTIIPPLQPARAELIAPDAAARACRCVRFLPPANPVKFVRT